MRRDREVRRDRPGRGGPDHREGRAFREAGGQRLPAAHDGEAHQDRRGLFLLVLDLRLRKRRAAGDAPVHRLVPAVDATGGKALPEFADDSRLVGVGHRQVGGVPVAEHAEPLELGALHVDETLGVLPALLPELGGTEFLFLRPERLVDLKLDRQAVAVPARDVWCVISFNTSRLYNYILEYFIERVSHVDMSVGIRGAVVENIGRLPGAERTQRPVHVQGLPEFQHPGLPPRQVGLHRKRSPRQVQRAFVVHRFAPLKTATHMNSFVFYIVNRLKCQRNRSVLTLRRRGVYSS